MHVSLKVLGNRTEFQRVASLLQDSVDFDIDVNASVFETNIRGGRKGRDSCSLFSLMLRCRVIVNRAAA